MPEVFIRPSNPATGHLSPYGKQSKQKEDLPHDLWKRPNYAYISQIHDSHKEKKVENLSFIGKYVRHDMEIKSSIGNKAPQRRSTDYVSEMIGAHVKKQKVGFFEDEDEDEEVGEPMRQLYDEPRIPQTWSKKALQHAPEWDTKTHPFDQSGRENSQILKNLLRPAFIIRYTNCGKIADPILRVVCQCFLTSRADRGDQWLRMIDNNVLVPISFILWRLFIEHDMASAILMKGGPETGGNLYGHSNFSFGNNVSTKMLLGNFTFYSKSMIWKEKNIFILENIGPMRYRGGSDGGFITKKTQLGHNAEEDYNVNRPSILVTAVPISFDRCDRMMSFIGKPYIQNVNENIDGPLRVTYPTYQYYDSLWGFSHKMTRTHPGQDDFVRRTGRLTPHAFLGQQVLFNRTLRSYNIVEHCQGHRKNASYPGSLKVWNGKGVHIMYDWNNFNAA